MNAVGRRLWASLLSLAAAGALWGCQGGGQGFAPAARDALRTSSASRAGTGLEFVGFWESWSDASQKPYHALGSIPPAVTGVDVAFSIADSNQISDPQNSKPLLPGIRRIHGHGGKVLLSFGGATSSFNITDVSQFEANLGAYFANHPGYYDGVDFDDEDVNANIGQLLTDLVNATRKNVPNSIVSFDAFMSGVDPANPFEAGVLQNAGDALGYVNVMDYDQYGWKPSDHPNCQWKTRSVDDCYLDVLKDFAGVQMPGGGTFATAKIVMGLMIGPADDGAVITPSDAQWYARWVTRKGYGGIMIWDVNRDGPQTTGHPKGTYITTIGQGLGAR